MTKKQKTRLTIGIALGEFWLAIISLLIFSMVYNPFMPSLMAKHFSNDANYHQCEGIIDQENMPTLFVTAENDFGIDDEQINSSERLKYEVFSHDIAYVWQRLNPIEGTTIQYTSVFGFQIFAIVQISYNGEEILAFEDGKSALLDYISTIQGFIY